MKRTSLTIAAMSLLPLLTGCPNPGPPDAIIHWHKSFACNGGQGQSGMPSTFYSASPGAYVGFDIDSVDNTGVMQSWTLDPTHFHVGSSNFDPLLMIYHWVLGPFALSDTAIVANKAQPLGIAFGALVVDTVNTADPSAEASVTNYQLLYAPAVGDPGVIMEESGSGVVPHIQNCGALGTLK